MQLIQDHLQNSLPANLELLRQMVSINSFTANAQGVNQLGALTANIFAGLGFQVELIPSQNPAFGKHLFLSRQPAQTTLQPRTIALVSHLDTVFPPEEEAQNNFYWNQDGERIYGPGTVDIKGGTIMIHMVLDAIRAFAPQAFESTHWLIALDASEETLSDDFGNLLLEHLSPNTLACLVFEGGTVTSRAIPIVVARKGRATFKVQVQGRSAHAGNNHSQGANAILQMSHIIQQIEAFTDYHQKITFNVGTVSGGSVVNRVPHYAEAHVEMRAFSPVIFQKGFQRMMSLVGSSQVASADGFACTVQVEPVYQTNPWPRNPATDRLYKLWEEAANALGINLTTEERGGLSDGNLLWQHFPTLDGLGPTGNNAHCSERAPDGSKEQEYLLIPSFVPKALLNITAILKLIETQSA